MWFLLFVQEATPEITSWVPRAFDEPNEVGIWTLVLSAIVWMLRTWWIVRLEKKQSRRVEQRIEREWTNGDATLTGKKNPGRTISELVELVHQDLQQHKSETNRRFDLIHSDIGKIKGKLDIN